MSIGTWEIGSLAITEDQLSLIGGTVTPGTPTSTTIPASSTAPTGGYAPYTYQWSYTLHGGSSWTNYGTSSLSATATGLTAATAYDIRLAYTDDTGFTVYSYANNVSTSGSGPSAGPVTPSLTIHISIGIGD